MVCLDPQGLLHLSCFMRLLEPSGPSGMITCIALVLRLHACSLCCPCAVRTFAQAAERMKLALSGGSGSGAGVALPGILGAAQGQVRRARPGCGASCVTGIFFLIHRHAFIQPVTHQVTQTQRNVLRWNLLSLLVQLIHCDAACPSLFRPPTGHTDRGRCPGRMGPAPRPPVAPPGAACMADARAVRGRAAGGCPTAGLRGRVRRSGPGAQQYRQHERHKKQYERAEQSQRDRSMGVPHVPAPSPSPRCVVAQVNVA